MNLIDQRGPTQDNSHFCSLNSVKCKFYTFPGTLLSYPKSLLFESCAWSATTSGQMVFPFTLHSVTFQKVTHRC